MERRKKWIPIFLVFGFLVFWLLYVWLLALAADSMYRQTLADDVAMVQVRLNASTVSHAKNMVLALDEALPGERTEQAVRAALGAAQKALPGYALRCANAGGVVYGPVGPVGQVVEQPLLHTARQQGYALADMADPLTGEACLAMLTPLPGSDGICLMQMFTFEQYAGLFRQDLWIRWDCSAIFDAQGTRILQVGLADADNHDQMAANLAAGMRDYLENPSSGSVQKSGFLLSYNVFIPMQQPGGWVWAGHIPQQRAFSVFSGLFVACIIPFAMWVVLIIVFIISTQRSRKVKRSEIRTAIHMDPLTGLFNAAGLEAAIRRFSRTNALRDYSLISMDIVAFHRFNNMYGFALGDELLRVVGGALRSEYDCCARTSGDIFAFLAITGPDTDREAERLIMAAVREKLGRQYRATLELKFGIFPIIDASQPPREIFDGALLALRDAKKQPKLSAVVYGSKLQEQYDLRKKIEAHMGQALADKEFVVYAQPKFSVQTGECCGGELLIRWASPHMGLLQPGQFVPLFESNGFIADLDFYMLEASLLSLQRQYNSGCLIHPLAVNQSRVTLSHPGYLERLGRLLARSTVPLQYLEIEVTESAMADDMALVNRLLHNFKDMGLSVSMDDFGTGYSSLNTLRELPVDVLKIDRMFLAESDDSERSRVIIKNVVNMSQEIGIGVVCEGVETEAQLHFLRTIGCNYAQGYLFSGPMPLEEFERRYAGLTGGHVLAPGIL